jgi:hypothetical protein
MTDTNKNIKCIFCEEEPNGGCNIQNVFNNGRTKCDGLKDKKRCPFWQKK